MVFMLQAGICTLDSSLMRYDGRLRVFEGREIGSITFKLQRCDVFGERVQLSMYGQRESAQWREKQSLTSISE